MAVFVGSFLVTLLCFPLFVLIHSNLTRGDMPPDFGTRRDLPPFKSGDDDYGWPENRNNPPY